MWRRREQSSVSYFYSLYLVEEGVQHADAEHLSGSERQAEHEHQVGALLPLLLWVGHTPIILLTVFIYLLIYLFVCLFFKDKIHCLEIGRMESMW